MLFEEIEEEFITNKIRTECSEYVKLYDEGFILYRGLPDNEYFTWKEVKSPENRKSMNSDQEISNVYNDYLKQKGYQVTRSNSLFTTKSHKHASEYGEVVRVFPKNGSYYHVSNHDDVVLKLIDRNKDDKKYSELFSLVEKYKEDVVKVIDRPIDSNNCRFMVNIASQMSHFIPEFEKYTKAYLFDPAKEFAFAKPRESQNPEIIISVSARHEILIRGTCYFVKYLSTL